MENQLSLDRKGRLSYVLQLRILQKLSESDYEKRDLEEKIEALMGGYEGMYEDIFDEFGIDESILSKDDCEKVWDILEMYRGIIYSYNRLVEDKSVTELKEGDVVFPGFDAHDDLECKMMFFVRYFVGKMGRFSEISQISDPDFNSHAPMLLHYEKMLKVWEEYAKTIPNRYLMSEAQICNLLKVGNLWTTH